MWDVYNWRSVIYINLVCKGEGEEIWFLMWEVCVVVSKMVFLLMVGFKILMVYLLIVRWFSVKVLVLLEYRMFMLVIFLMVVICFVMVFCLVKLWEFIVIVIDNIVGIVMGMLLINKISKFLMLIWYFFFWIGYIIMILMIMFSVIVMM